MFCYPSFVAKCNILNGKKEYIKNRDGPRLRKYDDLYYKWNRFRLSMLDKEISAEKDRCKKQLSALCNVMYPLSQMDTKVNIMRYFDGRT